ncbi:MAG TPA: hypothetical protein VN801_08850, partial [Candidatus Udaeobacter sp.]|nr:hypothetical protein [Candidatus Udaeobacter sp.]
HHQTQRKSRNPLFHRRKVERLEDYLAPSASATIVFGEIGEADPSCVSAGATVAAATPQRVGKPKCARYR